MALVEIAIADDEAVADRELPAAVGQVEPVVAPPHIRGVDVGDLIAAARELPGQFAVEGGGRGHGGHAAVERRPLPRVLDIEPRLDGHLQIVARGFADRRQRAETLHRTKTEIDVLAVPKAGPHVHFTGGNEAVAAEQFVGGGAAGQGHEQQGRAQ